MFLTQLDVHHLRNISFARLELHPEYNLIIGANGSGKTSLLEAFYLLSTGHSFRTRETSPLIQEGKDKLVVFARASSDESISIQKNSDGPTSVFINKQPCRSSSELARFLPCQIFYQDIFTIIDAGPSVRRNLLDWGMFHVKPDYFPVWKAYQRVVRQRNALLRQRAKRAEFIPWDRQLIDLSIQLDSMRVECFEHWTEAFNPTLAQLTDTLCTINYFKGWDRKESGMDLESILNAQFESDLQRKYTQSGAHQTDIIFKAAIPGKPKLLLSRGQQKILLIALKLAQSKLLESPCLYLLDDIAAELDNSHLERLFRQLETVNGQVILTSIIDNLKQIESFLPVNKIFTVDHGVVKER